MQCCSHEGRYCEWKQVFCLDDVPVLPLVPPELSLHTCQRCSCDGDVLPRPAQQQLQHISANVSIFPTLWPVGDLKARVMSKPALNDSHLFLILLTRIRSCCQISALFVNCTPNNVLNKSLITARPKHSLSVSLVWFCPPDLKVLARMSSRTIPLLYPQISLNLWWSN